MSDYPKLRAKIEISAHALNDLEEIWRYIAVNSEQYADRQLKKITDKFYTLLKSPEIGQERNNLLVGLRSFTVEKHIIFYQKANFGIEVVRVIHSSRDIQQVFDEMIPLEP